MPPNDRGDNRGAENRYENEEKGIFNGRCYCVNARRKALILFLDYFRIPLFWEIISSHIVTWGRNRAICDKKQHTIMRTGKLREKRKSVWEFGDKRATSNPS